MRPDAYRRLIEDRARDPTEVLISAAYLDHARIDLPGGDVVYSRDEIARYFRGAAPLVTRTRVTDAFVAAGPRGRMLAARCEVVASGQRSQTTLLALAEICGGRILNERLVDDGRALPPGGRQPAGAAQLVLPPIRPRPAANRSLAGEPMPGSGAIGGAAAHALQTLADFHATGDVHLLGALYTPGLHGPLDAHRRLRRLSDGTPMLAERVAVDASGARVALMWRMHSPPDAAGSRQPGVHLRGLLYWIIDGAGRVVREDLGVDEAVFRRRTQAAGAGWRPPQRGLASDE